MPKPRCRQATWSPRVSILRTRRQFLMHLYRSCSIDMPTSSSSNSTSLPLQLSFACFISERRGSPCRSFDAAEGCP